MKKRITILGSTGSIGTQALEVIEKCHDFFEVVGLSCGENVKLMKQQIEKFHPSVVCTKTFEAKLTLEKLFKNTKFIYSDEGLLELCSDCSVDMILVALSGKNGLKPTLKAIENKIDVALANKETLVMAGEIVTKKAKENNVKILPVDSEHSAIFQCIQNSSVANIQSLIITASGGPFRDKTIEEIKNATLEETLNHPRWQMGKKITVDSATLMNKGLEVIEAHHLFAVDYNKIKVVIHPQSIVHSAVEFKDGSTLAQIGFPSMHIPIQYALTYPQRIEGIKTNSFDFLKSSPLTFEKVDFEKFPSLKLAYLAGEKGTSFTTCLNAANEEAVFAFLKKQISLVDIYLITEKMLEDHKKIENPGIEEIFDLDFMTRKKTSELIQKRATWV